MRHDFASRGAERNTAHVFLKKSTTRMCCIGSLSHAACMPAAAHAQTQQVLPLPLPLP